MTTRPTPQQIDDAEAVIRKLFVSRHRHPSFRDIAKAVHRSFDAIDLFERKEELLQPGNEDQLTDAQVILELAFHERGDIIRTAVRVLKASGKLG